jgi:hypothetical protein
MAKNPHPSGRPIRSEPKAKPAMSTWRSPGIGPVTPRLQPKTFPVADAISYFRQEPQEEGSPWCDRIGFISFPIKPA